MSASDKLTRARTALVLEHPFFGALALRLKLVEAAWQETMMTDGRSLFYNPDFVESESMPKVKGVVAHEVIHCALGHPWRRGNREGGRWNEACDYAANPILLEAGFELPEAMLMDKQFIGDAAETIYAKLSQRDPQDDESESGSGAGSDDDGDEQDDEQGSGDQDDEGEQDDGSDDDSEDGDDEDQGEGQDQGEDEGQDDSDAPGNGEGDDEGEGEGDDEGEGGGGQPGPMTPDGRQVFPDPGGCGGIIDAPAPQGKDEPEASDLVELEQDWKTAVAQATQMARAAGTLGGFLEEAVEQELQPKADWRALLREFVNRHARSDYSWMRPNRRFIAQGVYLPGVYSETCPPIVVVVDTSGSVSSEMLATFQGELNSILEEVKPERVTVVYCDTRVNHSQEFEPDDFPVTLEPRGRGGTSFQPAFDWVEQQDDLDPACLIYLTDMWPGDTPQDPGYPVLWADYAGGSGPDQSFGERIIVE